MNVAASAALQARSVYALVMRRIRARYTGPRAGYVWAIVEPIIWVFVLKFAIRHNGDARPPVGESFEVFFATGVVLARGWRTAVSAICNPLLRSGKESLPTLHRLDAAYANWLLEMLTCGVALIIILGILGMFGFDAAPGHLLICLVAFAATAIFALSFGLSFALLLQVAPGLQHFRGVILIVMFFTSGFSFVVDRMPPSLREIVVWNPLLHCIEWFREGFYAGYECRSLVLAYLAKAVIATMLVGLAGERAFRRRARNQPLHYDNDDA